MIGICQNIIKQTTGFFLFSDNKKRTYQPKSANGKSRGRKPEIIFAVIPASIPYAKELFSQPSLSYGIGYRLLQ